MTLGLYAKVMFRKDGEREAPPRPRRRRQMGTTGTNAWDDAAMAATSGDLENEKLRDTGASENGRGGFRTCDLSRVKSAPRLAPRGRASPTRLRRARIAQTALAGRRDGCDILRFAASTTASMALPKAKLDVVRVAGASAARYCRARARTAPLGVRSSRASNAPAAVDPLHGLPGQVLLARRSSARARRRTRSACSRRCRR